MSQYRDIIYGVWIRCVHLIVFEHNAFLPYQAPHVDSTNLSLLEMDITPTDRCDNVVVVPEDDDEEIKAGYANNEYVESEDPHSDELEGHG